MWTVEEAKTQQKKERNSNISDGNRILETIIAQIQSSSHIQKVRLETTTQHETVIPKFPGQNHGNISDSSTSYISPVFPARILLYDLQSGRHETPVHSKPVQSLKEKLALCCKESGLGKLPHSSMICSSASSGCAIHPPASIPLPFFTSIACVGHVHCLIRRLRLRLPTLPLSRTISVWRTCKVTNKKKKVHKSTRASTLTPQFSPSHKTKRKAPAGSYRVEYFPTHGDTPFSILLLRIFCTKPGRPETSIQ